MKKRVVIPVICAAVAVLLVLFFPIPRGTLEDGGTRVYDALTYKLVVWRTIYAEAGENGESGVIRLDKTAIYWFPENQKPIDELRKETFFKT